ncbi:MAG: hypothetical protein HW419_2630, partial [Deltaproteobacteria bacterium]|nr:hypothetical protein [Deltaproteobacteria bacterium]
TPNFVSFVVNSSYLLWLRLFADRRTSFPQRSLEKSVYYYS